jgi:serine O-acetyltransferase
MMMEYLRRDLERLRYYGGQPDYRATNGAVLREALSPRFLPVFLCRLSHALYCRQHMTLARCVSLIAVHFFGMEIALRCEIGPGLCLPHTFGTVIGARRIGVNAVIYHEVTLGAKGMDMLYDPTKRPTVGDNVVIGSGAKVLGGIEIGDNVIIGANAVVTHSVPPNVVVGGIPARIIKERAAAATLEQE